SVGGRIDGVGAVAKGLHDGPADHRSRLLEHGAGTAASLPKVVRCRHGNARMRTIGLTGLFVGLALAAAASVAARATPPTGTPPLPPPRPPELRRVEPAPKPPSEPRAPDASERTEAPVEDQACLD